MSLNKFSLNIIFANGMSEEVLSCISESNNCELFESILAWFADANSCQRTIFRVDDSIGGMQLIGLDKNAISCIGINADIFEGVDEDE